MILRKHKVMQSRTFPLKITYGLPLIDMMDQGGLASVNPVLRRKFEPDPKASKVVGTAMEIWFNYEAPTETAEAELLKRGFKPATLTELLALATTQPGRQHDCRVALGTTYRLNERNTYTPFIGGFGKWRDVDTWDLDLQYRWLTWPSGYRFLGVHK